MMETSTISQKTGIDRILTIELTHDEAAAFERFIKENTSIAGLPHDIERIARKVDQILKPISKPLISEPAQIPAYANETEDERVGLGTVYHWLNWAKQSPNKADWFVSWALDRYGSPSGVIVLPVQLTGNLDSALNDRNTYSAIRYEAHILLIVCLAEIRDVDQFNLVYQHISTYYLQTYDLLPAFDASHINARMRLGYDPAIIQDAYHRRAFFFNEADFPIESRPPQSDLLNDESLILSINSLIQQGISQRKIAAQLGIPQARVSRLIAQSKA